MRHLTIQSTKNALIRALRNEINKHQLAVVEGHKTIKDLIARQCDFEYIIVREARNVDYENILATVQCKTVIHAGEKVIALFSDVVTPGSIIALKKASFSSPDYNITELDIVLFLHDVQDPGNMGSIIRTAYALNIDGIVISKECVNPFTSKVIRASVGSSLLMKIIQLDDLLPVLKLFKQKGITLYCAHQQSSLMYYEANLQIRFALILGSEGRGLPPTIANLCHSGLKIPMYNNLESLNVANCAAIILYEAHRQRMISSIEHPI